MRWGAQQDDFNNQLWNVVMLAMGGSALGEAVSSSGLLADIAQRIQDGVQGYGTWQVGAGSHACMASCAPVAAPCVTAAWLQPMSLLQHTMLLL